MIRPAIRPIQRRRGAVAVVVALCLIPLIGIMAFAFDGGLMLAAKRRSQTVADASAHAAAVRLYANFNSGTDLTGLDATGNAKSTALALASTNGYTNDGTTNTVKVSIPPLSTQSTPFLGKAFYAEVIVTTIQQPVFGAVLKSGATTITARAVARGIAGGTAPYSDASVIVLNSSAGSSLSLTGSGNITAESTIQVDSTNAAAANANNAGYARASAIQITGGYTTDASGHFYTTTASAVQTAVPAMADPLASLAEPTTTGLSAQSFTSTYGSKTIYPGVYSGGITMGNGMTITMAPGLYYMKSGSFTVANGVTLTGSGVTIFTDSGGGTFNIQGGARVTLTPPTTGTYAGISYFQDRTNSTSIQFGNGSSNSIAGTVYAPKAGAVVNGGTSNKYGSQLIVDSLNISNGASVTVPTNTDAKSGYTASGASTPSVTIVQ